MKSKQIIIYLEKDEEITSVIDRLVESDEKNVILVIPENALLGQSSVNLKLLKREAQTLEKSLALVTQDEAIERLAQRADFRVFSSLDEAAGIFKDEEAADKEAVDEKVNIKIEPEVKEPEVKEPEIKPEKEVEPKKVAVDILEELISQTKQSKQTKPSIRLSEKRKVSPKMADVVWPAKPKAGWKLPFRKRKEKTEAPIVSKERIPSLPKKALLVFFVAALLLLALVLFFVLPKAEVKLITKKEPISTDIQAIASRDISKIDFALNKIPAQVINIDKSKQAKFPVTGERQLNEKAKGVITIYNGYSSSPQTLVETTRFLSKDGKLFRTIKTIVVPGAKVQEGKIIPSTIDVEVSADQPGPDYNIGPSDFSIPGFKGTAKYTGFYGKSKTPMSGGETGLVKMVTEEDLKQAKDFLSEAVLQEAKEELEQQIPAELKLLKACFEEEVVEMIPSHNPGDKAEEFTLEIKVTTRALLFSEAEMKEVVEKNILAQISQDLKIESETLKLNYLEAEPDFDKWQVAFKLKAEGTVSEKVDIDEIKKEIVGENEIEVRRIFGQIPEIESAKITLWPFWVKKIPRHPSRVQIEVD